MRILTVCSLILLSLGAWAQFGSQTVNAQAQAVSTVYFYDGSGNLEYKCQTSAVNFNFSTLPTATAGTNANPAVITSTAHGFDVNYTPQVLITGAVSGWAAANGMWTATVVGANTFSIPIDSTGFGTFTGQAWVITTRSPRLTVAQWSVLRYFYSSGNLVNALWAGGTNSYGNVCANRATLSYQ